MREIKFRGHNGEKWLYGNLDIDYKTNQAAISDDRWWRHPVRFNTVGQFTGLCDCKGEEIYEGDVLDCKPSPLYLRLYERLIAPVVYSDDGFVVDLKHAKISLWAVLHQDPKCRVVGNVYDNPELLEENNARD